MESIFVSQISWISFVKTVVWLFSLFIILKILSRWFSLDRNGKTFWGLRWGVHLQMFTHRLLLIYEPLAVLIVSTALFFVDPLRHGIVLSILLVVGFPGLKNYINGRILLLGTSLSKATRIQTDQTKGSIARWERLGLYLQTEDGLKYIPYSQLVEHGFTLIAGERMGHQKELYLFAKDVEKSSLEKLQGIVATSPYLDITYKPSLKEMPDHIIASLVLKNEKYLPDLEQVLDEWGWESRIPA